MRNRMGTRISLGRIAGVEVGLTWSFLVILGLFVVSLAAGVFPTSNPGLGTATYIAMGVVAAVLFFASILLHEIAHSVQARREGMQVGGITLWLLGGVSSFNGMFRSPGAEFRIGAAGPLVTLVIGAILVVLGYAIALPSAVDGVVVWLGLTNLFVLAFNLLPAFPLDGGRILRSALWRLRGDLGWATRVAGAISRALGALMIAVGLATFLFYGFGGLWLALIGWFVMSAGTAEARFVEIREALAGLSVSDAMVRDPITVASDLTVQEFFDGAYSEHRHAAYPVMEGGAVVGLFAARDLDAVPRGTWRSVRVDTRMQPLGQAVSVNEQDELPDAFMSLLETDLRRALVLRDSRLTGLLSLSDVERLAEARRPSQPGRQRGATSRRLTTPEP
jgi:Zn-dependent protease/CBS domain-containing protein